MPKLKWLRIEGLSQGIVKHKREKSIMVNGRENQGEPKLKCDKRTKMLETK